MINTKIVKPFQIGPSDKYDKCPLCLRSFKDDGQVPCLSDFLIDEDLPMNYTNLFHNLSRSLDGYFDKNI